MKGCAVYQNEIPSLLSFEATNFNMNNLTTIETEDTFASSLLELAANDDTDGFKRSIEQTPSCVDEVGRWYGRKKGSNQMANEFRTPLMVAATYGSVEVVKLILSVSDADVNLSCGLDQSTALHCAASGGAVNVVDVVIILLAAGSDPVLVDASGRRPAEVIIVSPGIPDTKSTLQQLLAGDGSSIDSNSSPLLKYGSFSSSVACFSEKKEYPIDPSLPDIRNSIYSSDEFRMYSFKIQPCSRAYSHDWTECPFVHQGENARRRDPTKFHYSCVPCPDFRKGACRLADLCEYAHGVFECWLHPAQYRTRLCKDGITCARRVCFFAHTLEELRPLHASTGSAILSPRSSNCGITSLDFMNLLPGSPSSVCLMSPSPFTPPLSPSANAMSHNSVAWPQVNVPPLHLPASNFQSSRLRSSFNARGIQAHEFNLLADFDVQQQQMIKELSSLSQSRSDQLKTLTLSNLDDFFAAQSSSPRYSDQAVFSPTYKSPVLNQFQQQQNMLSPINTNLSHKNVDHSVQGSFGGPSSGRMSSRNIVEPISPMNSRMSMLTQREKQQQFRSLSSRELGSGSAAIVGSPVSSWSKWGSSNGKPDWAVSTDGPGKICKLSSFELRNGGEEPDFSWVQTLVKESPSDVKKKILQHDATIETLCQGSTTSNGPQMESIDHTTTNAD